MVKRIGIVLVLAWILSVGTEQCSVPTGLLGVAFAATQENGEPCPPECVTDSMEIVTWFPAPYGLYGELNSMKLAIGDIDGNGDVSEGDIPPADGQIYVDRGVIFKPIDPQNVDNDNINNMIHPAYDFTQKARQGEMVYTTDDKFYHYNGQAWVPQGSSGGKAIIQTFCPWRNDYRELAVGVGFASNWGMDKNGAGSYPCDPPNCPSGFDNLGIIGSESLSVACSGSNACNWDGTNDNSHPVSSGRVVRACREQ